MSGLLLAAVLTIAAAGAAPARAAGIVAFHTPSGNIYCAYAPSSEGYAPSIRCDIGTKLWRPPRKPAWCPVDYGQGLSLTAVPKPGQKGVGRASVVCAGDTVMGLRAPVLAYGRRFARGGISCLSAFSGLTCRNAAGHGFFLSRQRYRLF
ncbi:MAG: DUF6636 domain-containing protein [Gaiellaceae bacterium]